MIEAAYGLAYGESIVAGASGTSIDFAPILKADIYLADAVSVPLGALTETALDNLDLINWIINQDFGLIDNGDGTMGETYTDAEIQGAIWALTDSIVFVLDGGGTTENAQEILDMAVAGGEGFVAGVDDLVGLFVYPTGEIIGELDMDTQPFIVAVPFDTLADCHVLDTD